MSSLPLWSDSPGVLQHFHVLLLFLLLLLLLREVQRFRRGGLCLYWPWGPWGRNQRRRRCVTQTLKCLWNVLSHHLVMSGAGMCQTETRSSVYFFFTHRLYTSWIGQFCCLWVWWIWICYMGQSWMSSNSAASFPLACWLLSPLSSPEICRQMNVKHEGKALWLLCHCGSNLRECGFPQC